MLKETPEKEEKFKKWCEQKELDYETICSLTNEEEVEKYINGVPGKFADERFARWASDHNCKWNDSNFFSSPDVTTLSNCCRLLSNVNTLNDNNNKKLNGFMNSIGGTSLSIGSCKVNTINLVRVAIETYKGKDNKVSSINAYLKLLRKRTELCCKLLNVQREIIKKNIERKLLPNYVDGGMDLAHQYSTIGILGLYETMKEFDFIETDEFGNKSYKKEGIEFSRKIFEVLNEVKDSFTEDFTFNIESVPAERGRLSSFVLKIIHYTKEKTNLFIPISGFH